MTNSGVGVANCASSLAPTNSNNGMEFSLQHEAARIENYQEQLVNLLSHEGSAERYQSMDGQRQMDIEFANNGHGLEDHLFDEPNLNSLEKLLSGIEQEAFFNHPYFTHA